MKHSWNFKDLTNKKFGRLEVLNIEYVKNGRTFYNCLCSCGKTTILPTHHLTRKNQPVTSCGCFRDEQIRKANRTHGMTKTKIYRTFRGMVNRCEDRKAPSYKNYGGRGIRCEWKTFEEFRDDMYDSYLSHIEEFGARNTSIDRIDNNGNYSRENCRWATWREQKLNTRASRNITFNGKTQSLQEWAIELGINNGTLHGRIVKKKWPLERAMNPCLERGQNRKTSQPRLS